MTSSNIYIRTYEILDSHTDDHGKSTVVYLFLNSSSCLILETLFVLAMVQMSFFKWTEIWNKMRTMERFIQSPGSSHRKNRRHSIILIVIGFALLIPNAAFGFHHKLKHAHENRILMIVALVGRLMFEFHQLLSIVLFSTLTLLASANIQTITEKVKCYWPTSENASDIRFLKLKRDYYSVLNFTAEVDNLFGPPLLVFFIKSFISVVLKSFHIGEELFFNHHIWYKYLPLIIAQLLMIAVIIIVSELMKSNVLLLLQELAKREFFEDAVESKFHRLINEIRNNFPKISPMGMFVVSSELAVTLFGTGLTYLVIVAQFVISDY